MCAHWADLNLVMFNIAQEVGQGQTLTRKLVLQRPCLVICLGEFHHNRSLSLSGMELSAVGINIVTQTTPRQTPTPVMTMKLQVSEPYVAPAC